MAVDATWYYEVRVNLGEDQATHSFLYNDGGHLARAIQIQTTGHVMLDHVTTASWIRRVAFQLVVLEFIHHAEQWTKSPPPSLLHELPKSRPPPGQLPMAQAA